MAFCANCGAPHGAGAKFCENCGAPFSPQPITPPPPAPSYTAPTPVGPASHSTGSSTATKVIFAVLGVFALIALLLVGSCFYIGYRVRQRAKEFSNAMGADVAPYTGSRVPCAMLSTQEAAGALSQPVRSSSQVGLNTCQYTLGRTGNRTLDIQFTWRGGAVAMRMAHGVSQLTGAQTFTPISDLGDEAYLAPDGSSLMMRKGDVLVTIDLRSNGVSMDAARNLAGKIAARL